MGLLRKKGLFDTGKVLFLPVDSITPNPDQPRTLFSQTELEELSHSIEELGILQPLTVRRENGTWMLIAGERRLRAAKLAGLQEVPCLAVQADNQTSSLFALIENLQRHDLDFWDEALALRKLIDTYHLSQEEAAQKIGKSQSAVANKLRVLQLSPEILALLRDNGCSERHARALLPLKSETLQWKAAQTVVRQSMTVAQTEALVRELSTAKPKRKRPTFVIKDVRLFLNTITHSLDIMRSAGVDAQFCREDSEQEILLTIHIPRS